MSTESNLQNASKCDTKSLPTEHGNRSNSKVRSILVLIKKLWQNTITAIITEPELRIWQKQDRQGGNYWYVYDPWTNKTISFGSELEMLSWLDKFHSCSRS
jgi:hypothetical protein